MSGKSRETVWEPWESAVSDANHNTQKTEGISKDGLIKISVMMKENNVCLKNNAQRTLLYTAITLWACVCSKTLWESLNIEVWFRLCPDVWLSQPENIYTQKQKCILISVSYCGKKKKNFIPLESEPNSPLVSTLSMVCTPFGPWHFSIPAAKNNNAAWWGAKLKLCVNTSTT